MLRITAAAWWLAGVTVAMGGLVSLGFYDDVLLGLTGLIAGLILLPIVQQTIGQRLKRDIPPMMFLIIAMLLLLGGVTRSGLINIVDDQARSARPELAPAVPPVAPTQQAKLREPPQLAKQKAAQAPSYRPEQSEQILHKVQRSQTDAKTMHTISVDHAAQFKDCDAIVDTKLSPSSTSANLVMIVHCANRSTYTINESSLPSEQQ